jgi:H+-transporting ATPase
VVVSFLLSGIVFGYLLASGNDVQDSISFTVVLIVASIPIAIEIVCTTTLALGSKDLAKHGAIVTRLGVFTCHHHSRCRSILMQLKSHSFKLHLASIEDLAGMNMLCSDKTGTLTMNKMVIQDNTPTYVEGLTQYQLLRYAAMAAKWKEPPRDALGSVALFVLRQPTHNIIE